MVATALPQQLTPFHRQPAFIAGMVIIGIVVIFLVCGGLLCCIRPRSDTKYQLRGPSKIPLDASPSRKPGGYQRFDYPGEEDGAVTASWSPGDPTWVSIRSTRKSPEIVHVVCNPKFSDLEFYKEHAPQMSALCKFYYVTPTSAPMSMLLQLVKSVCYGPNPIFEQTTE